MDINRRAVENTTQKNSSLLPYLRLFDPFALLVPEKIAGTSKNNQQSDPLPDFFGSLLNVKKEANVVDVFENIFVTAHQVSHDKNTTSYDDEFAKFLDKYDEQKVEKLIDITDTSESDFELRPEVQIKVLDPKLNLKEDIDEDLVEELFLEKSVENMRLREILNNSSLINKVPFEHSPTKVECDKNTQNQYSIRQVAETSIANNLKLNTNLKSNIQTQNTQILIKYNTLKALLTPENSNKFSIEMVTKNLKLFRKQRIVKPEKEILNYAKGASLMEKTIILPKIMNRLANRHNVILNGEYKKDKENMHLKETTDVPILHKIPPHSALYKVESDRLSMSMIGHNNNMNNNVNFMTETTSSVEHDTKRSNCLKSTPNALTELKANQHNKKCELSEIFMKYNADKVIPTPINSNKCKLLIETVAKDPKAFNKQRIKPESEILKYTKGASLHEKSIVLPQIMERLIKTKMANKTKKNLPKKLILDTGTSVVNVQKNQYTHQREMKRKMMEEYINNQQIGCLNFSLPSSPNGHPSTSSKSNNSNSHIKNSNISASNLNKYNIEVSTGTDIQREILLSMILNIGNNGASTSQENDRNEGESSKNEESSLEVLMEDCNRHRLIEFERRRLFEKFVLGKM